MTTAYQDETQMCMSYCQSIARREVTSVKEEDICFVGIMMRIGRLLFAWKIKEMVIPRRVGNLRNLLSCMASLASNNKVCSVGQQQLKGKLGVFGCVRL